MTASAETPSIASRIRAEIDEITAGFARLSDHSPAIELAARGSSANVVAAIETARTMNIVTVGMTGMNGGRMDNLCDILIKVPETRTNRIQEMHIAVGHMLCGFVEDALC